ncbi:stage V sporulation protein B [Paenibacillus shirakamiensis]|uniref:Stage V sporulation protein B n=1 Tax=Paenibacillus shirakamiensis TaxID=1265935 RepID=A0ABS4JM43_9BACL|nr:polysaccharide biosynthesis protein [Paenibacillus shirakamiensis]MBP2001659.1 stage V sporulation protein B [Paenibacillus shirakamiensis]
MNKDSLLKGTIILTVAAFVARFLGFIQRIPLQRLLGDHGMGTYATTFNIYFILLTIATAGLPSAVGKIIAEKYEMNKEEEADQIFKAALVFSIISGFVMSIVLFIVAPVQARLSHDMNSLNPIRVIAPALALFPIIAVFRGYFQGRRRMLPNGLSQVVEQILRVSAAIGLAYLFSAIGWNTYVVAGASFGGVVGAIGALFIVLIYYFKEKKVMGLPLLTEANKPQLKYSQIYKDLFKLSIPIVIFAITVPAINYIDTTLIKPLLIEHVGSFVAQNYVGLVGGRAQALAGLPIIFSIAIGQSIVPIISGAYATNNITEVRHQSNRALQLALLTAIPVILLICVGVNSMNTLAFGDTKGSSIIVFATMTTIFQIIMQITGSILIGLHYSKTLVAFVVMGLGVKLIISFSMAPFLGIYGFLMGTVLCLLRYAS